MAKAMAVLRTIFLIFIVGFLLRGLTVYVQLARTFDEQYARCSARLSIAEEAAWLAIAWIAFETALGWWTATRKARPTRPAAPDSAPPAPPR